MEILNLVWSDPRLILCVGIIALLWRPIGKELRCCAAVVWREASCWGRRLLKAFLKTALPAPEALGERVGRWVRSKCGVNDG